jgi:hypothetical protein
MNYIPMRYSQARVSLSLSSFFYTIAFLVLIAVLSTTDSNILLPSPTMSQVALAADATITKIQFPGVIPNNNNSNNNNNNNNNTSSDFSNSSNASSNNNNNPPPPPLTHNTRARPAIGGPTLNDSNPKVEQIIDRGFDDPTSMAF